MSHWIGEEDIRINWEEEVGERESGELQSFLAQANDVLKPGDDAEEEHDFLTSFSFLPHPLPPKNHSPPNRREMWNICSVQATEGRWVQSAPVHSTEDVFGQIWQKIER